MLRRSSAALLALLGAGACRQDMHDNPRHEALEKSVFFSDGRSARNRVEGTVARGMLQDDELVATATSGGEPAAEFPFSIARTDMERGRERYDIFCATCHDRAGYGRGMVVQRGLRQPESFHIDRLRSVPAGYFVDVMTRGFGAMFDVADRVPPADRWRIAAYIRALQLSQNASVGELPAALQERLEDQP